METQGLWLPVSLIKLRGKCTMEGIVVAILMEMNIPTKANGFEYLKRAILLYHAGQNGMLVKDIYRKVGESLPNPASAEQIEKAICRAIDEAWTQEGREAIACCFSQNSRRPTNTQFISKIARFLDFC